MYNNNNYNKLSKRRARARMQARLNDKKRRIKNKKRKYMIYYIFFAIVILSSTITLSLTAFFKIEQINIICSNSKLDRNELLQAINLNYGNNLILFNSEKAIKNLLNANPSISYAEINKQFPDTVELMCKCEAPSFFIENQSGQLIGIAPSGRAVKLYEKNQKRPSTNRLTLKISTKTFNPPELGEFLNLPQQESQTLQSIAHIANKANLNNITKFELNEKLDATLTYEDRIKIEVVNGSKMAQIILSASEIVKNSIGQNEEGTISYFANDKTIHFIPKRKPCLFLTE